MKARSEMFTQTLPVFNIMRHVHPDWPKLFVSTMPLTFIRPFCLLVLFDRVM